MKPTTFLIALIAVLPLTNTPALAKQTTHSSSQEEARLWVKATSDGYLNLRAGPSTDYKVLRQMRTGTQVTLLSQRGDWGRVIHNDSGSMGWAHSAYFSQTRPTTVRQTLGGKQTQPAPKQPKIKAVSISPRTAWVAAPQGYLNLRKGPGTDYVIRSTLDHGDTLTVTARAGEWRKIRLQNGTSGWVHGYYLSDQPVRQRSRSPKRTSQVQLHRHGKSGWHSHVVKPGHRHSNTVRSSITIPLP